MAPAAYSIDSVAFDRSEPPGQEPAAEGAVGDKRDAQVAIGGEHAIFRLARPPGVLEEVDHFRDERA